MIFKILSLLLILAFLIGPTNTLAGETQIPKDRIMTLLKAVYLDQGVVKIVPSEIPNMYQVLLKTNEVIYVYDQNPPYLIIGRILRYTPGLIPPIEDIAEKLVNEEIMSLVPELKKLAIKIGNGPVEVIEIVDPDCPFCKQLHDLLKQFRNDVTRYVILYPLLPIHPDAKDKSIWILMSEGEEASRFEAVMDRVVEGKITDEKIRSSSEYAKAHERLSVMMKTVKPFVQGTPMVIIGEKVIRGFSEPQIKQLISRSKGSNRK